MSRQVTSAVPIPAQTDAVLAKVARRQRLRVIVRTIVAYALILPGAFLFMLPLLWMLSTALKEPNQIFVYPPQWIPNPIRFDNFVEGWTKYLPFTTFLRNTVLITTNNVIGNLVSCSLVAYGFARVRARGRDLLFLLVLATMMVPMEVTMIPTYVLFTKIGWVGTFLPLMVPAWFGWPFFIFLLRQFFLGIPYDLDDAARIDGCSTFGILWRIILPLSKPALATVAVFSFIGNWNNFLLPLIYLREKEMLTLAIGLNQFRGQFGQVDFHLLMAVSLLVLLPVLLVFYLAQRLFIQGIVLTGIKG